MGTADFIYESESENKNNDNENLKEANKDCKKCRGVGIDHYGRPCECRY